MNQYYANWRQIPKSLFTLNFPRFWISHEKNMKIWVNLQTALDITHKSYREDKSEKSTPEINFPLRSGGVRKKIPGRYDGVGGCQKHLFWDFFLGKNPDFLHISSSFFTVFGRFRIKSCIIWLKKKDVKCYQHL